MDAVSALASRLIAHKERWAELETDSGVPFHTFRKIAHGQTKNPRVETFESLRTTLDRWEARDRTQ